MATKKTKKVETPIDQMETFVSIQRNFADSDLSVEERLKTLYSLQQIDIQLEKIFRLRGELPLEVEQLENEIADHKAKMDNVTHQITETTRKIAEYKNQIRDYRTAIEKYKSQVDHVANSREYDSLNKEIENLDLLMQIVQKNIDESNESIVNKNISIETLNEKLAVLNDDLKAKQEELDSIVASTAKDEEDLLVEKRKYSSKLDARTMSAYDRIRTSNKNHLAVVTVYNGNACGGCFSTIPPQRLVDIASNKKMVICEYCGRILVNPEF